MKDLDKISLSKNDVVRRSLAFSLPVFANVKLPSVKVVRDGNALAVDKEIAELILLRSSISDQLNYGLYADVTIIAANSQAPTHVLIGEPIR